jgi:hypothetical protein
MELSLDDPASRNAYHPEQPVKSSAPWPIRLLQTVSSGVKRRRASLEEEEDEENGGGESPIKMGENTMRILKKRILSLDGLQERQGSKISEQELKNQRLSLAQSLCVQYNLNERDAKEVKDISQVSLYKLLN